MIDDRSVLRRILTGVQCALLLSVVMECAVAQGHGPSGLGHRSDASILPPSGSPPTLMSRELPEQGRGVPNSLESDPADFLQRQARGRWLRKMQPTDPEQVERPRMTREERRQLRQDVRQAGYEVYPTGDSPHRGRSGDGPSIEFSSPNGPGRP